MKIKNKIFFFFRPKLEQEIKIRIKPEKSGNPSWDIDLGNFKKLGQFFLY